MTDVDAYPLCWPVQVPRTPARERRRARFGQRRGSNAYASPLTVEQARLRLTDELRQFGHQMGRDKSLIVSSDAGAGSMPAWWDVLGVPRMATRDQVEEAFRRQALKAHPDRADGTETHPWHVLQAAHEQGRAATSEGA